MNLRKPFCILLYSLQISYLFSKKTIRFIPHTHDDVGWIVTFEEYYYGIKQDGVQYILDNVVSLLLQNPKRRFMYVEIAFFELWWDEQETKTKSLVNKIIQSGQLEFVNAGYVMNDEATCTYRDIIDQMTIGNEFILKNFGILPKIGWQIDTFGHSNTMAKIFFDFGFEAIFFTRLDDQDREKRKKEKALEFIWNPQYVSNECKPIFVYVTPKNYGSPENFEYDDRDIFDPVVDNINMVNLYNVDKKTEDINKFFNVVEKFYEDKNSYFQMFGNDFNFRNARMDFKNIEKIFSFNNHKRNSSHDFLFSTPSEYIEEIKNLNHSFPTNGFDFFPYGTGPGTYWTGFYTSRPIFKGQVRQASNILDQLRTFFTFLNLKGRFSETQWKLIKVHIQDFEKQLSICQHHDAITGTSKQYVSDDYTKRLVNAQNSLLKDFETFLGDDFTVCTEYERVCNISQKFEFYSQNVRNFY